MNADQQCWKACWGQPLASSNLASSATLTCANVLCRRQVGCWRIGIWLSLWSRHAPCPDRFAWSQAGSPLCLQHRARRGVLGDKPQKFQIPPISCANARRLVLLTRGWFTCAEAWQCIEQVSTSRFVGLEVIAERNWCKVTRRARSRRYGRLQLKPQAWERRYRMDNLRAVAQVIGRAASRSESAT